MIRTCDGKDPFLLREVVVTTSPSGKEEVDWARCDCGTVFDDAQRTTIYPHQYIPTQQERAVIMTRVMDMVREGLTAEQIREQLTRQPVVNYSGHTTPTPDEGNPMGEFRDEDAVNVTGDETEQVSAEGTENAETEAADESVEGTDSEEN